MSLKKKKYRKGSSLPQKIFFRGNIHTLRNEKNPPFVSSFPIIVVSGVLFSLHFFARSQNFSHIQKREEKKMHRIFRRFLLLVHMFPFFPDNEETVIFLTLVKRKMILYLLQSSKGRKLKDFTDSEYHVWARGGGGEGGIPP